MNRREFVGRTGAGALTALSYSRVVGANDRVGMALIGSGRRGREVMRAFVATGRVELRSLCDVYDVQRERARSALLSAGQSVHETQAHEESIARSGVDAVLIASPDHLHLGQTQAALAAGRHVYLEKPTSHRWEEAPAFLEAVRRSGKICQTGTQQRSGAHYQRVKEEIFGRGRLGKVVFARATWHDFAWQRRKIDPQPRPAGLAWERFLGPARRIPYDWIRYDSWRYFPDYGGGLLADILTHWADVAQWMLDDPHPLAAVAGGGIYQLRDGRVNPDTVNAIIEYGGGKNGPWNLTFESSVLSIRHERPGVFFQGTEGTLELTRAGYLFQPNQGKAEEGKAEGTLEAAHVQNFLDAIVRGTPLSAGIEAGLEACRPVHLAHAAFWKRRRMQMDRDARRIF
ncbi:MAG: Gfo/Idh/MocA family protein [Blastocatellia bacterium]